MYLAFVLTLFVVTDPQARIIRQGFEYLAPRTPEEFASRYDDSDVTKLNREDMASYTKEFVGNTELASAYRARAKVEHAKTARKGSPYITSVPMQTRALMVRRFQILKGGILAQVIQTAYVYTGSHLPQVTHSRPQCFHPAGHHHGHDLLQLAKLDFVLLLPWRCHLLVSVCPVNHIRVQLIRSVQRRPLRRPDFPG